MKTLIRILCLGLALALAAPAAWGSTTDQEKSKTHSKSASSSKSKKDKSSKKKDKHKKSHKGKESDTSGTDDDSGSSRKSKGKHKEKAEGGFRGLPWGSPLSVLRDPELREEGEGLKYYTVTGDDMDVLGTPMREIVYVFCNDHLVGALTRYDGQINHLALLAKLTDTWGAPLVSPPNVRGDRSWRFDAGESSVVMEYSESAYTGALAWMAKDRVAACEGLFEQKEGQPQVDQKSQPQGDQKQDDKQPDAQQPDDQQPGQGQQQKGQ